MSSIGQVVLRQSNTITNESGESINMNVNNLANGLYYVSIKVNNRFLLTKKMIINKNR